MTCRRGTRQLPTISYAGSMLKSIMGNSNTDAHNLHESTIQYMKGNGFTESLIKVDDGGWEKDGLLYLIEEKSERESFVPASSWWKYNKDDLLGQRVLIKEHYRTSDKREFHQNKWMIVISQLGKGIVGLSGVSRDYKAIFAIPSNEVDNFREGFERYNSDPLLNKASYGIHVCVVPWPNDYAYTDQRGINTKVKLIEINQKDYFGKI